MRSGSAPRRALACLLSAVFLSACFVFTPQAPVRADYSSEMMVRVGIAYGSSVAASYTVKVQNGVSVGIMTDSRTFKKLAEFPSSRSVTAILQKNTTVGGKTVGNHHLQLAGTFSSYAKANAEVKAMKKAGIAAYVAYVGGTFRVRAGAYASADAATKAKSSLGGGYSSKVSVVSGAGSGTMLYDNTSKTVIFESEGLCTGIRALQLSGDGKTYYLSAPSGYLYDGVFEFSKYGSGVEVVNVLDLDTYALGVLPWEIYPTWPQETLNAFAITVRTLAVYHYGARHNSAYGFDVCPTSHCQNYKGMTRDYASLRRAVAETSGEIAVYDGKAIMGIYCGTNGGVTEDVRDIWGGNVYYPYLTSVTIPLEVASCVNQPSGVWQSVVTPKELSSYFSSGASYDSLKVLTSPIVALNVKKYSKYSGVYIYELEFVDAAGHTASVSTSSRVRGSLVKYCKSAYFSISYNYDFAMQTAGGVKTAAVNSSAATVLTADGAHSLSEATPATLAVLTADGKKSVSTDKFTIQFDGKGNGHGGGISMYGAVDLANAGYTCDEILKTYFPGVDVLALGVPAPQIDYADDGVDDGDDTDIGTDDLFTPCLDGVETTTAVNLRTEPNTSSKIIKQLKKGTVLLRTGSGTDGWDRVFYEGGVAYIYAQYATPCDPPPTQGFAYVFEAVQTTDAVNVRTAPNTDGAVIMTVGEGAELTRVGVGDAETGFDMVLLDSGVIGYVTKAAIVLPDTAESFTDASDLVTAAETANLRAAPDTTSDVLESVPKGTVLVRTGVGAGDFDRVLTTAGATAYVMKRSVSESVNTDGFTEVLDRVVTTETVNARKDASTSAAIITTVKKGTELTRTGIGANGWDRVQLPDGATAYIKNDYLAPAESEDPNGKFETVRDTVVTTEAVNLREGASTSTKVLAQVKKGTELVRTGIGANGWDRVLTPSGATAYVYKQYVTKKDDGFEQVSDTVTTTAEVNLRAGPSTSSAVVTTVKKGTVLSRTGIGADSFDRVLAPDGTVAYVSKSYIK